MSDSAMQIIGELQVIACEKCRVGGLQEESCSLCHVRAMDDRIKAAGLDLRDFSPAEFAKRRHEWWNRASAGGGSG